MSEVLIKELINTDIKQELDDIGFDSSYSFQAQNKFLYKNFKIFNLKVAQANIIKQTALSVGADCGTHKEVITGKQEISSCILGGNLSQLKIIAEKLQHQPFGLKNIGLDLAEKITNINISKTKIMGILNLTKNSFSDGGKFYDDDNAINQLNKLIEDGADIIDIGAESTKPGSTPVPNEEQLEKLIPILKYIKENNITVPISIDTRSSEVAKKCIEYGANIINDVSGFEHDNNMVNVISNNPNIKIIIQHSKGTPETMQDNPQYTNLMDEIYLNLFQKVEYAISKGIKKENIIIDPGIGFGKTISHNFEIIRRWEELKSIGCPVLLGLSRKSLLNMPDNSNEEKDLYTLALNSILIEQSIDIIRVHNVKIHKNLLKILNN